MFNGLPGKSLKSLFTRALNTCISGNLLLCCSAGEEAGPTRHSMADIQAHPGGAAGVGGEPDTEVVEGT